MRLALVATLGVLVPTIGCSTEAPQNLQPVVAVYGCYTMMATPVSPDGPAGPGKCENCSGTGKVGDGRVMVDCPVCGGDGTIEADEVPVVHPITVPLDALPAAPPPKQAKTVSPPRSVRIECRDGSCRIVR